MKIKHALIDYTTKPAYGEILLFTGNAYITKEGKLVMGRGAAKQVRDHYTGCDTWFGHQIQSIGEDYGIIIHKNGVGVFQVKYNFCESADLALIRNSARHLGTIATTFPSVVFKCNFPGIGNGKLAEEDVRGVLYQSNLPDNVEFYI